MRVPQGLIEGDDWVDRVMSGEEGSDSSQIARGLRHGWIRWKWREKERVSRCIARMHNRLERDETK